MNEKERTGVFEVISYEFLNLGSVFEDCDECAFRPMVGLWGVEGCGCLG